MPSSECTGDLLAVAAEGLFVAAFHKLPDIGQQLVLLFGDPAADVEQVGGVFVHEDGVVGETAHQLMDLLQLFRLGGFFVEPLLHGAVQGRARYDGQHGGVHHGGVQAVVERGGLLRVLESVAVPAGAV